MNVKEQRSFVFEGAIRGQGRPRAAKRGNHASVYKSLKDRMYEMQIRAAYLEDWKGLEAIEGPFRMDIKAVYQCPDSWSRKKRRENMGRACMKKPDIDNLCKSVLDALQKNEKAGFEGAFVNDKDCAVIFAEKRWGLRNRMEITISKLEAENDDV